LFWTVALPEGAVEVHPGGGAEMRGNDVQLLDFGNFGNSLFGGGPPPLPATVSFLVRWAGGAHGHGANPERAHVVNTTDGHAGEYIRSTAQMQWSATIGDFDYVSAPIGTSSSDFAEFGKERNGVFFNSDGS
jgi:hypothetical protein